MGITFNVTISLSAADKSWLAACAVAPIVVALAGIRDAIGSQQEALAGIKALEARFDAIDPKPKP